MVCGTCPLPSYLHHAGPVVSWPAVASESRSAVGLWQPGGAGRCIRATVIALNKEDKKCIVRLLTRLHLDNPTNVTAIRAVNLNRKCMECLATGLARCYLQRRA